jgi:miniconductance mechanosensitive channel
MDTYLNNFYYIRLMETELHAFANISMIEKIINNYQFSENQLFQNEFLKIILSISLLIIFIYLINALIKFILTKGIKKILNQSNFEWDKIFYQKKVFHSISLLLSFSFGIIFSHYLFKNSIIDNYVDRFFGIVVTIIFIQLFIRLIEVALLLSSKDEKTYKTVAVRTFSQFLKVVLLILGLIIIISVLFNVPFGTLITSITAISAILLLVFRDTIIGFVSGIQISSSEIMKAGDWIFIEKYNLEGIVKEINLVTTKIESFDKTISSIPTYDILSSKLKNYQPMLDSNKRRIKRGITFNAHSFQFYDLAKLQEVMGQFPLLKNYMDEQNKIDNENKLISQESEITNIGLFRAYTQVYLENHPRISKSEIITTRQLPMNEKGVPMEVFCFVKTSIWVEYEKIVADLFDHLIIVSKKFDLEISQAK